MYMGVYHVTVHHTSYDKIMYIYLYNRRKFRSQTSDNMDR